MMEGGRDDWWQDQVNLPGDENSSNGHDVMRDQVDEMVRQVVDDASMFSCVFLSRSGNE